MNVRIGRLTLWFQRRPPGASFFYHVRCAECRNFFIGPFGLEWGRHT